MARKLNRPTEVIRCNTCGKTKLNHPTVEKGQSAFSLIGSEFTCTTCGWSSKLVASPYYSWLYIF